MRRRSQCLKRLNIQMFKRLNTSKYTTHTGLLMSTAKYRVIRSKKSYTLHEFKRGGRCTYHLELHLELYQTSPFLPPATRNPSRSYSAGELLCKWPLPHPHCDWTQSFNAGIVSKTIKLMLELQAPALMQKKTATDPKWMSDGISE